LGAKAPCAVHANEQGLASGSRAGVDTTGVRPAQLKQQISSGNRIAPQDKAHSLLPDRTLQHQAQLPQQGSSTSISLPRQFAVAAPKAAPVLKASDSDVDIYFNDEDNDALFAIEDSAIHGVGSCDTLVAAGDSAQGRVCGTDRDVKSESSIGAVGTRPHGFTGVNLLSADH
jgi:hypothetical protein